MMFSLIRKALFSTSLVVLATLSLLVPATANAAQQCDNPRNDFDGLYCLSKVYQEADKDLNTSYSNLRKYLNSNQRAILKRGQLAWMRERNDNCSRYTDEGFLVNMRCATDTTTSRINFLHERLRECRAGDCRTSRLDD